MRHFLFSLLIFTFQSQAVGQVNSLTLEDIENADDLSELESELDLSDFDAVDDIGTLEKNNKSALPPRVLTKPRLKTKWTPQAFRAILKKGSLITRLKDGKGFHSKDRLFVRAKEIVIGGSQSYLLDKNRKAIYQTFTKNLISIEDDLKLYPQVDPKKTYEGPTKFHSTDKSFKLENDITFHLENVNVDYFTLFYGGEGTGATANTFGIKSFYRSSFPINAGLGISYQGGSWINADVDTFGTISWTSFYFGPYLKYDLYQNNDLRLNMHLGIEKSIGFETISENGDILSFESLLWNAEVKALYNTLIGVLSLGVEYKKQRANLKSGTIENLLFFPDKGSITSLGLVIGYHFDLNL